MARLHRDPDGVTPCGVTLAWELTLNDDRDLDCENMLCPLPVLKARKSLLSMNPGQTLRIRTTDRMALIDLPHFCTEAGHQYLGATHAGPVTTHVIQCG